MWAGAGGILIFESIVVVVFDWFALWVELKGPEAVKMDLLTEAGGHRVHQEPSGWTLYVDIVGQPKPNEKRNLLFYGSCDQYLNIYDMDYKYSKTRKNE